MRLHRERRSPRWARRCGRWARRRPGTTGARFGRSSGGRPRRGFTRLDDAVRRAVDHAWSRRSRALRRLVVASTFVALSTVFWAAGVARGHEQPRDSGHADPGGVSLGVARRRRVPRLDPAGGRRLRAAAVDGARQAPGDTPPEASEPASPAAAATPPRRIEARSEADARELTVLTFDHTEGAERAYADARARTNDAPSSASPLGRRASPRASSSAASLEGSVRSVAWKPPETVTAK
jgi:hypothetical protein